MFGFWEEVSHWSALVHVTNWRYCIVVSRMLLYTVSVGYGLNRYSPSISANQAGLSGQRTVALFRPTDTIVGAGNKGSSGGASVLIGVASDHVTCPHRMVTLYRNQYDVDGVKW